MRWVAHKAKLEESARSKADSLQRACKGVAAQEADARSAADQVTTSTLHPLHPPRAPRLSRVLRSAANQVAASTELVQQVLANKLSTARDASKARAETAAASMPSADCSDKGVASGAPPRAGF